MGADGGVAEFDAVVVHGGGRFLEELRNFGRFGDAQADEGEDAEFVAQLALRQVLPDALVLLQQGVQLGHEVRENAQEGAVEFLEQGLAFRVDELVRLQRVLDFLQVHRLGHAPQRRAVALQAVDVVGEHRQVASQIGFLDVVGFLQFHDAFLQAAVDVIDMPVGLGKPVVDAAGEGQYDNGEDQQERREHQYGEQLGIAPLFQALVRFRDIRHELGHFLQGGTGVDLRGAFVRVRDIVVCVVDVVFLQQEAGGLH